MDIGLIGYGKVNQTLAKQLKKNHKIYTTIEGRSQNTINNAQKTEINILKTNKELAQKSDLLISANTPSEALKIAQNFSKYYNKLYLDLNNINPKTSQKIAKTLGENYIDGAIIGKVTDLKLLLLSGPQATKLEFLKQNNINIKILSQKIGDASTLKMLRSIYTKGVTALLIETFDNAKQLNLNQELWEILELTENTNFKSKSTSRIENTKTSTKRKNEELKEILKFLENNNTSQYNQIMTKATKNKFKKL
jgi:3-hydroxyisobutyrate dehydrogenase-like beta-hydroxyacid dehydrogenase